MSEDVFKLKGSQSGLQLVFEPGTSFEDLVSDIRNRLESGAQFFKRGTVIQLLPGRLPTEQEEMLRKLFHQYGVLFRVEEPEERPKQMPVQQESSVQEPPGQPVQEAAAQPVNEEQRMMVINRTIRSGQEIQTQGSVLICGNVNPGAEIIAGGSIDIRGTCRGIVHAGAYGDRTAFIIADCLMPVQVRIADLIAQAPDTLEKPSYAEKASIKNDHIVIEPIER